MFSLPVPPYQQSARANSTKNRPGKRKRKGYHIREQQKPKDVRATDGYAGSLGSSSPPRHFSYSTVLTPDEIYQYAVAGQAVEVELPSYPFPHAKRDGPSRYDYDLRQQVKSAHASPSERYGPIAIQSLHHQHLAVMTTILHRSLLEEDFVRAGRALGMILRDEVGGRPVDVRAEGRWGIGAEILMRQDAQRQQRGGEQDCSYSKEPHRIWKKPVWFTRKGFEDAKKYYERLIVQYPFFKQNPNAISARDFYPAMFGLWIYVVHREARLESHGSKSVENGARQLQEESVSHVIGQSSRHQPTLKELSQAREIADRMDAVMSGPPYREDSDLIELRRMVRLWIHDLEEELAMPTHEDNVRIECEDTPMQFLTSRVINVSLQSQV